MGMTLRKRVPPPRRSPSPEMREATMKTRARKVAKPSVNGRLRRGRPIRVSDSESELESDSDSDSEPDKENGGGGLASGYESIREQRMRENRERMEKLGIFSLSSQMFNSKKKPIKNLPQKRKRYPSILPRPPRIYESRRRSDRLMDVAGGLETERSLKDMGISIPDGWKPEVYTEEDEKLLGDYETKWILEEDGYEDGDLMYDPVSGMSCHQCRNKTGRKHTYCSKCRSPQGQLCGDCLYTRYGENVLEATQNPTWLCPACRGICNCSRCRQAKGWSRFTVPYAKVIEAGFKSVAHYIILNRCAVDMQKKSEDGTVMVNLTEQETQAPMQYDCSDKSSDWSAESDSDDSEIDDSQAKKKNTAQSIAKEVDIATVPETFNEAASAADKNEVLPDLNC